MNKKLLLGIFVLILLITITSVKADVFLYDYVNRSNSASLGTPNIGDAWVETAGGEYQSIDNNWIKLVDDGAFETTNELTADDIKPTYLRVNFTCLDANGGDRYIWNIMDGASYTIRLGFCRDNVLYYYDGNPAGWVGVGTINDGVNYMIEAKNIDYSNYDYDLFINGVEVVSNVDFASDVAQVDKLYMNKGLNAGSDYVLFKNFCIASGGDESLCVQGSTPPTPTSYFDITAIDNESSTAINTFNVTINLDNGTNLFYSTTNGTINTNINESLNLFGNITFKSNNYFDRTYSNYNTSIDLEGVLLYKDEVAPVLVTNFQNLTISYYDNLTYDFNFTDELELETINISINGNTSVYYTADAGTNVSNQALNYVVNSLPIGKHELIVFYCDGHGFGCINSKTNYYNFYIGNYTPNSPANVLEIENINVNLTVYRNSTYVNNVTSSLKFNNIVYATTKTIYPTYYLFERTIPAPLLPVGVNYSDYNISWNISIDGKVNDLNKYSIDTITVHKAIIGNCNSSTLFYNFTFWDEQTKEQHNGSIQANFNFTGLGTSVATYLDYTNVKEAYVCINDYWTQSLEVDAFIQYIINDTYDVRNYFILGDTINNISESEDIKLYNIKQTDSNLINFNILDNSGVGYPNVYIHFQRYIPEEDGYYLVAHSKTDDNGDTSIYLRGYLNPDAWYLMNIYSEEGELLWTTTPTIFYSNNIEIKIEGGGWSSAYTPLNDVDGVVYWNNNTNTFTGSFSTITGVPRNVCLKVIERKNAGFLSVLYDECVHSAGATGGVLSYTISEPEYTHNAYLYTYTHSDWNVKNIAMYNLQAMPFDMGVVGVIVAFVLILLLSLIGSFSPVIMIIMGIVGVIVSVFMLGLVGVGNATVIALIVIGGIFIVRGSSK